VPSILRINDPIGELVGTADSQEGIQRIIEGFGPGRYLVDGISSDPSPSGHTSRRWGVGIKRGDWTISVDHDPWPAGPDSGAPS
jgi:hypothetical protein